MASRMDEMERIDRMIVMAEQRRAAALRAIAGRRARFAAELRRVASEMEKAEPGTGRAGSAVPQAAAAGAQPSA